MKGKELIQKFTANEAVIARLAEREFDTEEAAKSEVEKEMAYVKEASGSGKVEGLGESAPPPKFDAKALNEAYALAESKYGIGK